MALAIVSFERKIVFKLKKQADTGNRRLPQEKVLSPFPCSDTNKRYHTYSYYLKQRYGQKLAKIPLDAGFTCPNRDGTKGYGGCRFCSSHGSGDTILCSGEDLRLQYEAGLERARRKWPDAAGIAYFQSFSNTYAPLPDLRRILEPVFCWEDVTEVSIATRPDCLDAGKISWLSKMGSNTYAPLPDLRRILEPVFCWEDVTEVSIATRPDCLDAGKISWLSKMGYIKPVWIEMGLQSAKDATMTAMNRGHGTEELAACMQLLKGTGIRT